MKYIVGIYMIFLFCWRGISTGFLECSIDPDCVAEKSKCVDNICECPTGEVFSSDGSACLPIAVGIKAECIDDQQCAWLLGKYRCHEGKCDCEEGWRYNQGRCIKAVGLFQVCSSDTDCFNGYDILAMRCSERVCSCNEGYYLRGNYDCRPEAEICDYCSLNSDCKVEGTVCSGSICNYPNVVDNCYNHIEKNHSAAPKMVIRPGYDTSCETSSDCMVENSVCYPLTKRCICKRGYFFKSEVQGCVAELGVDIGCTNNDDCQITPGRCISGKCYCPKSYFSTDTNNACQKPMTHDNLFCNNVERCYVLGKEVVCEANKCKCSNAEPDEDYICRREDPNPEENCHTNPDLCNNITNLICIDRKCQCPENYRLEGDVCLPNLGALCDEETKLCQIENAVCSNNQICACQENHIQNGLTTCLKLATGLGSECEINKQCSEVIKYSECGQNGCQCIAGYFVQDGACKREKCNSTGFLECSANFECMAENSECINSICQCPGGHVFSSDGSSCLPIAVGIKAECTDDKQCGWLLGKHICYKGKCECQKGWRYLQGSCTKSASLFEPCTTDWNCFNGYDLLAMRCIEGICSCSAGYYLRGDYDCRPEAGICDSCSLNSDCKTEGTVCSGSLCVNSTVEKDCPNHEEKHYSLVSEAAVSQEYDVPCEENSDCKLKNSVCYSLTKKCICKRGYFFKLEAQGCIAELGVPVDCQSNADCQITPGECRFGTCFCKKSYFSVDTNTACQKPMTHDNLFCNNVERCYVLGKDAVCEENTCKCNLNTQMDENYICRPKEDPTAPEEDCPSSIIKSVCVNSECNFYF